MLEKIRKLSETRVFNVNDIGFSPHNPRFPENQDGEEYEELKESIRQAKLKTPLSVTYHPERGLETVWGGNSRLKACRELGSGFENQTCHVIPFEDLSESSLIIAQLAENVQRKELGPLEVLLQMHKFMHQYRDEIESGQDCTLEQWKAIMQSNGLTKGVNITNIRRAQFLGDWLWPYIPNALKRLNGNQIHTIDDLSKLRSNIRKLCNDLHLNGDEIFCSVLDTMDEVEDLKVEVVRANLTHVIHEKTQITSARLDLALIQIDSNSSDYEIPQPGDTIPPPPKKQNISKHKPKSSEQLEAKSINQTDKHIKLWASKANIAIDEDTLEVMPVSPHDEALCWLMSASYDRLKPSKEITSPSLDILVDAMMAQPIDAFEALLKALTSARKLREVRQ